MVAVITTFLTIFLLIFSVFIQDWLTNYFYSIGLADFPSGDNPIMILQILLLPIIIPFSIFLSKKILKNSKKFSVLFLKVTSILVVFLIIAFFIWKHFVPQVVPQMIFDDTQKALEIKDFKKVIFRYERIEKLYPSYAAKRGFKIAQKELGANVLNSQDIYLYMELAEAYRRLGNYGKTIEILQKGLELHPENMDPETAGILYENLGLVYYDSTQLDNAVNALKKAIEYDPKQPTIYINLGTTYEKKGVIEESIKQYRIAIQLDPKNALAHNNLGYSLALQGNIDEAIVEFKKALALDPNLKKAQENLKNFQTKQ